MRVRLPKNDRHWNLISVLVLLIILGFIAWGVWEWISWPGDLHFRSRASIMKVQIHLGGVE